MATLKDCVVSGEDMDTLVSNLSSAFGVLRKYGIKLEDFHNVTSERKAAEYGKVLTYLSGCQFVSLGDMADLIFAYYKCPDEDMWTKMGFLVSRLRVKKFLTHHKGASRRLYNCGEGVSKYKPEWLVVPDKARQDHSFDFTSQDLHFYKDLMKQMLFDLYISKEGDFIRELQSYKAFEERRKTYNKNGGN